MTILSRLTTAIATGAVFLGSMAAGASANVIDVSGNGAFSRNSVDSSISKETTLIQSNDSDITNSVHVNNDTGGNTSSFNTGGSSSITTGDAVSFVNIKNEGNTNIANLPSCGCTSSGSDIFVHGNGAFSKNEVSSDISHETTVVQSNTQDINNWVDVNNSTGDNTASFNTGGSTLKYHDWDNWYKNHMSNKPKNYDEFHTWFMDNYKMHSGGNSSITTGDAFSKVNILNKGGINVLH